MGSSICRRVVTVGGKVGQFEWDFRGCLKMPVPTRWSHSFDFYSYVPLAFPFQIPRPPESHRTSPRNLSCAPRIARIATHPCSSTVYKKTLQQLAATYNNWRSVDFNADNENDQCSSNRADGEVSHTLNWT
ncbi:unnamed protein product [Haemonchus placei]|uniref:Uncharacterized protein n=1 Tax=Haemonchus placei TaxID=6290 RepID=A0A0N4WG82_HAEPC|nr:unnamed protein product [Haemonchus placei]